MSKAFDKVLNDISKKNPTLIGDEHSGEITWIPIDSPQMTYMLGGGVPCGRMIRFRGPASAGKSVTCDYLAAACQKECPRIFSNPDKDKVIYVDFERSFEDRFAHGVGLSTDRTKFVHLLPDSVEEACDAVCEMIKTGEVAAIVFDSDGLAPTNKQMVDESGKASFGGSAKAISELLTKWIILCANHHTTLLWISQERVNMKPMARLPISCVTLDTMVDVYEN